MAKERLYPHLERPSALLHPGKVITGNGPYGIGVTKYLDGTMAAGVVELTFPEP
jgi:hypothetical protein